MNEKGFTVAELIVSFVIIMTIALGLFATVDSYRETQQIELYRKSVNSYMNEILANIQNDNINRGGIENVTSSNVFDSADQCYGYNEGIVIKYRDNVSKHLCIGNGRIEGKDGILYGDIYLKKPTKFLQFIDDIIYDQSEDYSFTYGGYSSKITIWSINIRAKHTEIDDVFNIEIVSPRNIPLT